MVSGRQTLSHTQVCPPHRIVNNMDQVDRTTFGKQRMRNTVRILMVIDSQKPTVWNYIACLALQTCTFSNFKALTHSPFYEFVIVSFDRNSKQVSKTAKYVLLPLDLQRMPVWKNNLKCDDISLSVIVCEFGNISIVTIISSRVLLLNCFLK